jgi:hypothetical protein
VVRPDVSPALSETDYSEIHPPEITVAILECLDLPARAPPISPARLEEEEQVEFDFGC